jgi:hypothetical protein
VDYHLRKLVAMAAQVGAEAQQYQLQQELELLDKETMGLLETQLVHSTAVVGAAQVNQEIFQG